MEPIKKICISIKSKKHPEQRCPNKATKEDKWCAIHFKNKIEWNPNDNFVKNPSKNEKVALQKIKNFWYRYGRGKIIKQKGILTFVPECADNEKDIYSYDSVQTIPLTYRFSYSDPQNHHWLFDLRFLLHLLQYGSELKNPFTQEQIPTKVLERLQKQSEHLQSLHFPVIYMEQDELTPEQIWNQKVLDVFLKMNSLGYSANILWFENFGVKGNELFYTKLYELWNHHIGLTEEQREKIVPGHKDGRGPLFRWHPSIIVNKGFDLRWWRKINLNLMKTFLTRSEEKENQTCGALYILITFANIHPHAASAFPYLVAEVVE
jgi:hypothetical protein